MRDAGLFAHVLSGRQLVFGFGFGTSSAHRHVPRCPGVQVPPGAHVPCVNGDLGVDVDMSRGGWQVAHKGNGK